MAWGSVESRKFSCAPPTSYRIRRRPWHHPLSQMEGHMMVPPYPTKTMLGPQGCDARRKGFLVRCLGASSAPGVRQPQTDFDSGLTSQAS